PHPADDRDPRLLAAGRGRSHDRRSHRARPLPGGTPDSQASGSEGRGMSAPAVPEVRKGTEEKSTGTYRSYHRPWWFRAFITTEFLIIALLVLVWLWATF